MTATIDRQTAPEPAPRDRRRGWFAQLLLRLHFFAGLLVGPFILVAALSGAAYAVTPALEPLVYAHELRAPVTSSTVPLAEQIAVAEDVVSDEGELVAVRPAPNPGDTTRVMFTGEGLGESYTRAIFVDPGTAEVRGDLPVYGTSGAMPIRSAVDQFHRSLGLGDFGRLYSELAASWLGVVALAGIPLWVVRIRKARRRKEMLRPEPGAKGYRRTFSWHASTGVWLLLGALFLSATGITWSQFGGENVTGLRAALNWQTPSVSTTLTGGGGPADEHAGHGMAQAAAGVDDLGAFDEVLAVAQTVNVNTGLVEIKPPADADSAWTVTEIQRSFPTEVDAVAIDGATLEVVDRVDFADYPFMAKLARWGIDTHMGSMFGLPNQILLVVTALGIAAMVVFGYVMWWQRRPTTGRRMRMGRPAPEGALAKAPWWGLAAVIAVGAVIGWFLPLLGGTLVAFVVLDAVLTAARPVRSATPAPAMTTDGRSR